MKLKSSFICLIIAASPAWAGKAPAPGGRMPMVHRLGGDLLVAGDFQGAGGIDDWLMIDRNTGMAVPLVDNGGSGFGSSSFRSRVTSYPLYSGIANPTDACPVWTPTGTATVVSSGIGNGLSVITQPVSAPSIRAMGTMQAEPGALVAVAPILGGGASASEDALVFCGAGPTGSAASWAAEVWVEPAAGSTSSVVNPSVPEAMRVFDPQPLALAGGLFIALRERPGSSISMGLGSLPTLGGAASATWLAEVACPGAAHLAFAPFSGASGIYQVLAIRPGSASAVAANVTSAGLTAHPLGSVNFGGAVTRVDVVRNPVGYRLFVIFSSGSASVFTWDGVTAPVLAADLGSPPSGDWLAGIDAADGSIGALHGSGGLSSGLRTFAYDAVNHTYTTARDQTLTRPGSSGRSGSVQAVAYSGEPFVVQNPSPLASFRLMDWGRSSFGNVFLLSESYADSMTGLAYPGAMYVGGAPAGSSVAVNQWSDSVSLWFGNAPSGGSEPVVTADPPSSTSLRDPVEVELSAQGASEIRYRVGTSGSWTTYSGAIPPLTEDSAVEACAVSSATGRLGPIRSFNYQFVDKPGSRDSDGDGIPDLLESEMGSDPLSGDSDGDSFGDLAELIADLKDGVLSGSVTNPGAVASAGDVEAAGAGRADFSLTVTADSALASSPLGLGDLMANPLASVSHLPAAAATGSASLHRLDGVLLTSAPLHGPSYDIGPVDLEDSRFHLVVSSDRHFDTAPFSRTMRSDFTSSANSWTAVSKLGNTMAVPRAARTDDPSNVAATVNSSTGSKEIHNQSAPWIGNFARLGLPDAEQDAAGEVRGIRAEVRSLDPTLAGKLFFGIRCSTTWWVSRGVLLDAGKEWGEIEIPINEGEFTRISGSKTFALTMKDVEESAFFLTLGDLPVLSGVPAAFHGTSGHDGFSIDRIRAIGQQAGGHRVLAATPVPDISFVLPTYVHGKGVTTDEAAAAWLADYLAALGSASSPTPVDVSVQSTVAALIYEQALNASIDSMRSVSISRTIAPALDADETTDPDAPAIALADMEFLRYPSDTTAFPSNSALVSQAREPMEMLELIRSKVAASFADNDGLAKTATALYRLASSYDAENPGRLGSPLRALRSVMQSGSAGLESGGAGELASLWQDALGAVGVDPFVLDSARDVAASVLSESLGVRRAVLQKELTLGDGIGDLTDSSGLPWRLLNKDGAGFPLPLQFGFPSGTRIRATGYALDPSGGSQRLELTGLELLELPRTTPEDLDGDLLDDRWEMSLLQGKGYDGFSDPDNDGLNNLTEYLNGTDPLSADAAGASSIAWPPQVVISRAADGQATLTLEIDEATASQFSWTVESSTTLAGFSPVASTPASAGGRKRFTVSSAGLPACFYRLKAALR